MTLALLLLASCQRDRGAVELPPPEGPPSFQTDLALRHADQFEGAELRDRPAGSQQEQGAAVYILGVLQRHGYIVRLDGVPVRNLVTSTNVIASSPRGDAPEVVVVVSYDSPAGGDGDAEALGLFLELSRALNVATDGHAVWFAALGADHEDALGSRRLVEVLMEEEERPLVIRLHEVEPEGALRLVGAGAARLGERARTSGGGGPEDVFAESGFDVALASGGIGNAGRTLLRFLVDDED